MLYLYLGNDLRDMDGPYPCCHFEPLLDYSGTAAQLRCPTPSAVEVGRAGLEWLRYESPPPYVLRALVHHSAAAAYVSALLVEAGNRRSLTSRSDDEQRLQHLAAILRTARDDLAEREIAFTVVILPDAGQLTDQGELRDAAKISAITGDLGIPTFNAAAPLAAALARQEIVTVAPGDPHFNPAMQREVAAWLRDGAAGVRPPTDRVEQKRGPST